MNDECRIMKGEGVEIAECGFRIAEWRKLSVVSLQLSVECLAATRRGASKLQNEDCGLDNQSRERQRPVVRADSSQSAVGSGKSRKEMRNADFGLRNGEQRNVEKSKVQIGRRCESRTTMHEPRKSSVAEQSHFGGNARPQ